MPGLFGDDDDFDFDSLFREEFHPEKVQLKTEPKPSIEEIVGTEEIVSAPDSGDDILDEFLIPAEDSVEDVIKEDAEFELNRELERVQEIAQDEEVLTGTVLEPYVEVLEGEVIEPKSEELSALQIAVNELQAIKDIEIQNEAQENALRAKINETQKLLDQLKNELETHHRKRNENKARQREAETKVSEEAHLEAERQREEEIKRQRKSAMMAFHSHINDLKPEWQAYAFDHQWEGASTLALHEGGLLADDMGLGKTLTTIMIADMLDTKLNLVITPSDTNSNFTMEYAMWAKHRFVYTLAGATKKEREVMMEMIILPRVEAGGDVTLLINYEQLYYDFDYFEQLLGIKWDAIFIDEFHNAKNKGSLLFSKIKSFRNAGVKRFYPITGTFILNKPEDIWTALHVVDPEAFPTIKQFRDHYCEYDYYTQKWVFRPGGERSMLIRLGGRIVKRSMKEAGIVLPEQKIHIVDIEFPDGLYEDQKSIMRQLAEHSQIILDSDRKVSIVEQIALITRQRQCAVWPAGIEIKDPETGEVVFSVGDEVRESIKLDWVQNKIAELRQDKKRIVVFSQFKTALAELERRLLAEGYRVARYDGDTTREIKMVVKRDFDRKHVDRMNGEFVYDIVLCNFKTGGVGLNFTHATEIIMLDEEWNPGKNTQAYKRTNRIGQTEENNVWIPQLKGAIDRWMRQLNVEKQSMIDGFDNEVDLQKEFSDFLSTVKDI